MEGIFQRAFGKSETTFVKQNGNLVHECGFRVFRARVGTSRTENQFLGIWIPKPKFS